ncbi:Squalene-hopene cyclase C-terminal domain-containing protein [Filimonas lacunae]|uniref:Squalene-hopene cyclase C-terminal domain-containing protein n=1 Tax=Filimonas lacunae TaxID=477680 RepID=A0A173MEA8_9BACT|nr:prenyltransferase/squalene oxidase repeat-containing protein [Filimonas lacunae]BAV05932.1 squalene-hopene cyclase [Filimonas lacunae]SIT23775.1 Squalene-hopene cyclase C-terminal domain-containing protein [Filimonas lacunae]
MIQTYKTLIESLSFDAATEQELLKEQVLQEHYFYLHLVLYLSPAYPSVPEPVKKKLGAAVYLYFRFALACDKMIDQEKSTNSGIQQFFVQIRLLEAAVRELSALFPSGHVFWQYFEKSRTEYIRTMLVEKKLAGEGGYITVEQFEKLAAGKSALCYAVPIAISLLQDTAEMATDSLQRCLEYLHIGFQYMDDIDDFLKDVKSGQPNIADSLLRKKLEEEGVSGTLAEEERYKLMFLSGVATACLQNAITWFEKSRAEIASFSLAKLDGFITGFVKKCLDQLRAIELLIEKARVKASCSKEQVAGGAYAGAEAIRSAIEKGRAFLAAAMQGDGSWTDFLTNAGLGRNWITAYVAMNLAEAGEVAVIPDKAAELLNSSHFKGAFNDQIKEDGDSLNFLVGYLNSSKGTVSNNLWQDWRSFCNDAGGWRTYQDADVLKRILGLEDVADVSGWLSAKSCVSAAALYVLAKQDGDSVLYHRTAGFLMNEQMPEGYWKSYWWSSPVYATAFALQALSVSRTYQQACAKAADWLKSQQAANGAWSSDIVVEESPLYTAMAMKALLCYNTSLYDNSIRQACKWLLDNQTTDGSWQSSFALLVPAPDFHESEAVQQWSRGSFGVNIIVEDHYRVFSTATIVNALECLLEKKIQLN